MGGSGGAGPERSGLGRHRSFAAPSGGHGRRRERREGTTGARGDSLPGPLVLTLVPQISFYEVKGASVLSLAFGWC